MRCPVCFVYVDNPKRKTCHRKKCMDMYKRYKKINIADIDIKDIRNKMRSNTVKIRNLKEDQERLTYIRNLYENSKTTKKATR